IVNTAAPELTAKLAEWGGAFLGFIAKDVLPYIVGKLTALLTKITTWIITTALPKIVSKLAEWAGAFLGWVADVVRDLPGKLLSIITTIEQWATDNLSKAGEILKDIGKALIDGLIGGITDKFNDLKDKLGEVTDLIPDWKGPMSKDRKLLQPTGMIIMEGLEEGIARGARDVERRLAAITKAIGGVEFAGDGFGGSGGVGARV